MKPYRTALSPITLGILLIMLWVFATPAQQKVSVPVRVNTDAASKKGADDFYNLDYDKSIREFEAVLKTHLDDPFAVNHLLTAVLFKELYRIGALDTELYSGDSFLTKKQFSPIDPKVSDRVKELTERALSLEETGLKQNPNDVDTLYARGVTRGLRSTWMGLAQKAWFAALRSAVGARKDHDRVLELNPNYVDAKTIVGVDNYVTGSLPWAVKVAASVAGFPGNKQKGLDYLRDAAAHAPESGMDAKITLALFLRREQRYPEALAVVDDMHHQYPHNFLIASEQAHLLNAAGHGKEAVAAYQEVLEEYRKGWFPVSRPEQAAFGLGEAARGQHEFELALNGYNLVSSFKNVDPDMQQRANLGAGEMLDMLNRRDEAMQRYNDVVSEDASTNLAELARRYMKTPYRIQ
jgi:tetratricopeptide (TPR) repeat protein